VFTEENETTTTIACVANVSFPFQAERTNKKSTGRRGKLRCPPGVCKKLGRGFARRPQSPPSRCSGFALARIFFLKRLLCNLQQQKTDVTYIINVAKSYALFKSDVCLLKIQPTCSFFYIYPRLKPISLFRNLKS